MKYELKWSIDAVKDLSELDRAVADRITKKTLWFCQQSSPWHHAEPLTGTYKGIHRFRVGDYRILFEIDHRGQLQILMVLRVKHRREVYR